MVNNILMNCRVVHINYEAYDEYIGRPSIWGNPFTHIADKDTLAQFVVGSREEALNRYREYLLGNEELMLRIMQLDGKILGCWCIKNSLNPPFPYICHGQIILEVINQIKFKQLLIKR